jgi:hypothetical protein
VSPEVLMELADNQGFKVVAWIADVDVDHRAVRMLRVYHDQAMNLVAGEVTEEIMERGREILSLVERDSQEAGDGISSRVVGTPKAGRERVQITVRDVASGFYQTVLRLVESKEALRLEQVAADQEFDRKVEDEINQEPEIMALEGQVVLLEESLEAGREAVAKKRRELRGDREKVRGSYRYVTSEREV